MPKWIEKIGIAQFMFILLYLCIAFLAVSDHNPIDILYFIALTVYFIRIFIYFHKKKHKNTL